MTDIGLEFMALKFLRYQKRCMLVICERSPRQDYCGVPDVFGVTAARYTMEIEVKRTLSDFRADSKKPSRQMVFRNNLRLQRLPKYFWYLVPPELAAKVEPLVPEWAGLMRGPGKKEVQRVCSIKQAPANLDSQRLTIKECCRLTLMVNNHALSAEARVLTMTNNFRYGWQPWPQPDFEI
jgi:hypothetical protein